MAAQSAIPPRERDVIRAIIKALDTGDASDMNAFAMSYVTDKDFRACSREQKAVKLLRALVGGEPEKWPSPQLMIDRKAGR